MKKRKQGLSSLDEWEFIGLENQAERDQSRKAASIGKDRGESAERGRDIGGWSSSRDQDIEHDLER